MGQLDGVNLKVDIVVFCLRQSRLEVLLEAGSDPTHGKQWILPGRLFDPAFSLENLAQHEMQQCAGIQQAYLEQLYTYSDLELTSQPHNISVVYFALVPADHGPTASSHPLYGNWFPVDRRPVMAEDYETILAYALRRLRYKLEYTAVGFELLPETFTLSELQNTYEIVLGEKLDKRNFRRRILSASIIEPTVGLRSGEGRPARLYRYRPDAVAEVKTRRLFP
jgi:8-oxo-dGTP diphosphatase